MVAVALEMEYLAKQGEFMRNCDAVSYSGYIGGYGSGKTHILVIQCQRLAAVPSRGLIGAPTYRMLEDTTREKFFELTPPSWIRSFHKSRNVATLVNGTEVLFRSMENPGRLAGLELDWFGIDEVGEVKEDTFKMLQGRMKISHIRKGNVVGNPAGPAHWTYEYFVVKAKKFPKTYRLVQATSYENTYLPEAFTKDMEISYGADTYYYKRYVLGLFVAAEGCFWPNFNPLPYPQGHVMSLEQVKQAIRGKSVRFGKVVDFGFEHPFVCLWYVTDGSFIIFFDEYRQKHGLIRYHCLQVREHERHHQSIFGPHRNMTAWTDHEAVSRAEITAAKDDEGNRIGFDCIPVEKKVMEGILLVQTLFGQRRLFVTSNCERTLREIPSYHSRADIVGEEPDRTEDEDACCCIRYASWAEMNHQAPYKRYKDMGYVLSELKDAFAIKAMR